MNDPILVVDLEATCSDDGAISAEEMETIEIGACWVAPDGRVLDRFQSFVCPVLNPRLTKFCSDLTGISQGIVDSAPRFPEAADLLSEFVQQYATSTSSWTSWGAYDNKQIARDSVRHGITAPITLPHLNAKKLFAKAQRIGKEIGMAKACELTRLGILGTHHRALDDAVNVARLLPWVFAQQLLAQRD